MPDDKTTKIPETAAPDTGPGKPPEQAPIKEPLKTEPPTPEQKPPEQDADKAAPPKDKEAPTSEKAGAEKSPNVSVYNFSEIMATKKTSIWKEPADKTAGGKEKAPKAAAPKKAADKGSAAVKPPAPEQPKPQEPPKEAPRRGEEQIVYIKLDELHAFKNHPLQVRDDEEMRAMVSSVKDKGVTQPANVTYAIDRLLKRAKDFKVDGALFHSNRSCKGMDFKQYEIQRKLESELGIPSVIFDGDQTDPSVFSEAQYETRVQALVEMMAERKRKEGTA